MTFQPKLSRWQTAQMVADIARGMTKAQAAEKYGIHVRTVFRIIARDPKKPQRDISEGPSRYTAPPRKLKPHGTNAAYARHLRKKERPCTLCCAAHAEEVRLWKRGQNPMRLRKSYAKTAERKSA